MLVFAILLLSLSRLAELWISRRNLVRLRASGVSWRAASSEREYAVMACVHALFLVAPLIEFALRGARGPRALGTAALLVLLAAQLLRFWAIHTLGPRWNARAVVAASLGALHVGPYRFMRHPNYVAVLAEFAALPFVAGSFVSGGTLFLANAFLLARRIKQEERLMADVPGWLR